MKGQRKGQKQERGPKWREMGREIVSRAEAEIKTSAVSVLGSPPLDI